MSRWGSASRGNGKNDARSKGEDRCGITRAKVESKSIPLRREDGAVHKIGIRCSGSAPAQCRLGRRLACWLASRTPAQRNDRTAICERTLLDAGICALLRLGPFTPHDLRRTAATLVGNLGFDDVWIAKCLDHTASKKQEQIVPSVTGKVYNHSKRMKEKRAVLDGVAAELQRIIGWPAETGLRLVA